MNSLKVIKSNGIVMPVFRCHHVRRPLANVLFVPQLQTTHLCCEWPLHEHSIGSIKKLKSKNTHDEQ